MGLSGGGSFWVSGEQEKREVVSVVLLRVIWGKYSLI